MNHLPITNLIFIQVMLHSILLVQVNINTSFNYFLVFLPAWNIYLTGTDTHKFKSYGSSLSHTWSRDIKHFPSTPLEWKTCPCLPLPAIFSSIKFVFMTYGWKVWIQGKCILPSFIHTILQSQPTQESTTISLFVLWAHTNKCVS